MESDVRHHHGEGVPDGIRLSLPVEGGWSLVVCPSVQFILLGEPSVDTTV